MECLVAVVVCKIILVCQTCGLNIGFSAVQFRLEKCFFDLGYELTFCHLGIEVDI